MKSLLYFTFYILIIILLISSCNCIEYKCFNKKTNQWKTINDTLLKKGLWVEFKRDSIVKDIEYEKGKIKLYKDTVSSIQIAYYKNGILHGRFKQHYYLKGSTISCKYKNGKLNGLHKVYFNNEIGAKRRYKNGLLNGWVILYRYQDGKRIWFDKRKYKNNNIIGGKGAIISPRW